MIAVLVAALVPNVLGAIYYGPLLGKKWLSSLGYTAEDMKGRNEALLYGSALLLSVVVSFFMKLIMELTHKTCSADGEILFSSFHSVQHGALHGSGLALGFVLPVIICLGLFQKTKASNILINSGFWLACFAIMGAILDAWN